MWLGVNGKLKRHVDASIDLICTPIFVHRVPLSSSRDDVLTIVDVDDEGRGRGGSATSGNRRDKWDGLNALPIIHRVSGAGQCSSLGSLVTDSGNTTDVGGRK